MSQCLGHLIAGTVRKLTPTRVVGVGDMSVVTAFRRIRREEPEFQASLGS